jgi:hypothetical protein
MKKIFFNKGVAYEQVGLNKQDVQSIEVQTCNECGFDFCDCAIILKDLDGSGDKYAIGVLCGELVIMPYADFVVYKASKDVADLNETVVGTQS